MLAAQPGGRHQETAGGGYLPVERTHRGVEKLRTEVDRLGPGIARKLGDRIFPIEPGQPVDAVNRALVDPGFESGDELIGRWMVVDRENLHAALAELLDEYLGDGTPVRHDDDARCFIQLHARGLAELERRPKHGERNTTKPSR